MKEKHTLSRRRIFLLLCIFLLADSLNTAWYPAGRMTWLLCPLAGLAGGLFYRQVIPMLGEKQPKVFRILWLIAALYTLSRMLGEFGLFIAVTNDFIADPAPVLLAAAALMLWLCLLPGHGLRRTAELVAPWIAGFLALSLVTSLEGCDFGHLLPIWLEDGLEQGVSGLLGLLARPFAGGFLAIAVLHREAEEADLKKASLWAGAASGVVLLLHHAKNMALVGWALASRYRFPVYALTGLRRSGGSHMEDLLLCALLAARVIKGALLLRFVQLALSELTEGRARPALSAACGLAAALLPALTVFGTEEGLARTDGWAAAAVGLACMAVPMGLALLRRVGQRDK